MPTDEEFSRRIDQTLGLVELDPNAPHAQLVRDVLERFGTPPPELNDEFARLLQQIREAFHTRR
jgi:hypothetical protein